MRRGGEVCRQYLVGVLETRPPAVHHPPACVCRCRDIRGISDTPRRATTRRHYTVARYICPRPHSAPGAIPENPQRLRSCSNEALSLRYRVPGREQGSGTPEPLSGRAPTLRRRPGPRPPLNGHSNHTLVRWGGGKSCPGRAGPSDACPASRGCLAEARSYSRVHGIPA